MKRARAPSTLVAHWHIAGLTVEDPRGRGGRPAGTAYLHLLNWSFALFSSTRLLTYLPTLWAIHASGDSSQHSLLTWLAWVGSNLSMAAWLYEQNGRRCNKAIAVVGGNALMCIATCGVILAYR